MKNGRPPESPGSTIRALPVAGLAAAVATLWLAACSGEDTRGPESISSVSAAPIARGLERSGRITGTGGQPIAGAFVTMSNGDTGIETTVFTDANGEFALSAGNPSGTHSLIVRAPGYVRIETAAPDPDDSLALALQPDPEFRKGLPSSRWLDLLPAGDMKKEFVLNCGTCHGLAHDRITADGAPRNADLWYAGIAMMRALDAYSVIPPDFDDRRYAAWLAEHLSADDAAKLAPAPAADPAAVTGLTITEYPLPHGDSLPHDLVLGPDGRVWITAFFYDEIWALDPEAGDIQRFPVDDDPEVNAQPRALEFDGEGDLWIVNGGTEAVIRLHPDTGDYESFDIGMYAHSLDLDSEGNVWVNDYFAAEERIARLDRRTGEVTIVKVPSASLPEEQGLPLPYGLQIDGEDRLYSTQLAANTLVRYDIRTGEGTLYEMPVENAGPRRPGTGADGRLWIPEFNTGHVTAFDPQTGKFERVDLGLSTLGAYDVEVNAANGDVWITGSLDSSLLRYRADGGSVARIPLPTEPAYTRHIAIDSASGDVWSAYSSLPPATPKIVRLSFSAE